MHDSVATPRLMFPHEEAVLSPRASSKHVLQNWLDHLTAGADQVALTKSLRVVRAFECTSEQHTIAYERGPALLMEI